MREQNCNPGGHVDTAGNTVEPERRGNVKGYEEGSDSEEDAEALEYQRCYRAL